MDIFAYINSGYYGGYYDVLRERIGEERAFSQYSDMAGKWVFAETREPNSTRLFIMGSSNDYGRKEGWWNVFTITDKPVEKQGLYVCHIESVKQDKCGYPIYVVSVHNPIDLKILSFEYYHVLDLFYSSDRFIDSYNTPLGNFCNVIDYVDSIDNDFGASSRGPTEICSHVFDLFREGKISIDKIKELLEEATPLEKYKAALRKEITSLYRYAHDLKAHDDIGGDERYIHIIESAIRYQDNIEGFSSTDFVDRILDIINKKYRDAVKTGKIYAVTDYDDDPFCTDIANIPYALLCAESYLKFDKVRKAANSAKKKAAKKAKKNKQ